ncbi:bifunctional alpha,alpha-trehalose-phosphate synthase (UDP-forming)/trehalose-phosphatase [Marispirochaeta aestuarii]|uniref:Bifunctional alpha,alpha-trehalose-phosphate synthase (UDP-forming)/trehalose-phosphatase n=1 Tax=Marispirochaeta aestuarii TaxID=1963862 RepID=A0A1Y1RUZ1_9SPIO|nr:bifunctional alpha,alpha-trehalose-phosphate synthase (UDP-forming)/trehalose-phosphatase [Marispirochaeta aestuarii]ORC32953.1 bifunctional alpha,alpha-trehalose-phosphate synthase (UDP-forming)/trehalose-phosphatase [Marispirochaeta aestuarii]
MAKIIYVSNRLPVTINRNPESGEYSFTRSIGGLATGLSSVHNEGGSLWVGWSGLHEEDVSGSDAEELKRLLMREESCVPFQLSRKDFEDFYLGFCNEAIWPLFHYFPNRAHYHTDQWEAYFRVNRLFFEELKPYIEPGDTIWVHDYQLMLLPQMIREEFPEALVGFFLHIPFPSYEIMRLMPWREEIMEGLMGSDLLGFHTYDYVRHFISSARRLLGYEFSLGYLTAGQRLVRADVFPMGIDYEKYNQADNTPEVISAHAEVKRELSGKRTILSVDRLDYTKGIPERIKSFALFLDQHPEYHEKVELFLIVAPSRTEVEEYQDLLKEIRELVSATNGRHGSLGWTPIHFFYRSFSFEDLTALYMEADLLLVTALRDGMNLIAKEYLAARRDDTGVLILSETAGAVHELGESLMINPNDLQGIADAIDTGLKMDVEDQKRQNSIMKRRISRYNVRFWARDFVRKLEEVHEYQRSQSARNMIDSVESKMLADYEKSRKAIFFLDYDGTLVGFRDKPEKARPDAELLDIVSALCKSRGNRVVVISGREPKDLESFFSGVPIEMAAGHGSWVKMKGREWEKAELFSTEWKEGIRPILESYTDRTPGSFIEEKEFSLAWHYRRCEPDLAALRVGELKDSLYSVIENMNIGLLDGNKVLEVKDSFVNKGIAASEWLRGEEFDFIFAVGDDYTDEDLFDVVPDTAYSIKVGMTLSKAKYHVKGWRSLRGVLKKLARLD